MDTSMLPPPLSNEEREKLSMRHATKPFRMNHSTSPVKRFLISLILGLVIGVGGTYLVKEWFFIWNYQQK